MNNDKLNTPIQVKSPSTELSYKSLNPENINKHNLMNQITSNISKATGLGLSSMLKNFNEIDPIVIKHENINVNMVIPMPN